MKTCVRSFFFLLFSTVVSFSAGAADTTTENLILNDATDPYIRFDEAAGGDNWIVSRDNRLEMYVFDGYKFRVYDTAVTSALVLDGDGATVNDELTVNADLNMTGQLGFTTDGIGGQFIEMYYTATDQDVGIRALNSSGGLNDGGIGFSNDTAFFPFWVFNTAQDETMAIRAEGVGIGLYNATSPLHVYADGTPFAEAKVTVENNLVDSAARTLFELRNPGNTKFEIINTDANESWAFTNSGTDFRVSRQGSGVVEFSVKNNGDAELAGMLTENSDRNSKQAIEAVDGQQILRKVAALPIAEWSYKDSPDQRHVGPMAQDFYAAFGLGGTDKGIASMDSAGVALAAIQALAIENQQLKTMYQSVLSAYHQQQTELTALRDQDQRVQVLEKLVKQLVEAQQSTPLLTQYSD